MKKVYASIYNEDSFEGISIPFEIKPVLEEIMENTEDLIDDVFDDYESYRDAEVEMSHCSKDGSEGTFEINSVDEFKKWFSSRFNRRIKSNRVPQRIIDLVEKLEIKTKEDKILSDDQARKIIDDLIDGLTVEYEEYNYDERKNRVILNIKHQLINFRDNWLDKVL